MKLSATSRPDLRSPIHGRTRRAESIFDRGWTYDGRRS